jgi:hypothetical protein
MLSVKARFLDSLQTLVLPSIGASPAMEQLPQEVVAAAPVQVLSGTPSAESHADIAARDGQPSASQAAGPPGRTHVCDDADCDRPKPMAETAAHASTVPSPLEPSTVNEVLTTSACLSHGAKVGPGLAAFY